MDESEIINNIHLQSIQYDEKSSNLRKTNLCWTEHSGEVEGYIYVRCGGTVL